MASTIWTGSISFGLVSVPVKLLPATRSQDVSFHQLEEGTGSRIRYHRVSETTGQEVPLDRIVKGYELEKGRYVVVEKEELDALSPQATRTIDIEDFVDLAGIDPLYFDTPYYVVPDKRASKPYRLLVEAMTEMGKVAIGRLVLRSKERLVAVRPLGDVLCVEMMRYEDELVDRSGLDGVPDDGAEVSDRERAMARQLIEALSTEFEPSRYRDRFREEVLALIERKAAGEDVVHEPEDRPPAKVLDLVAALEASLERTGRGSDEVSAPADSPESSTASSADDGLPAADETRSGRRERPGTERSSPRSRATDKAKARGGAKDGGGSTNGRRRRSA